MRGGTPIKIMGYDDKMMRPEDYEDKHIRCRDCQETFCWDMSEQAFFAEKGFKYAPSRCVACRHKKKREAEAKK